MSFFKDSRAEVLLSFQEVIMSDKDQGDPRWVMILYNLLPFEYRWKVLLASSDKIRQSDG